MLRGGVTRANPIDGYHHMLCKAKLEGEDEKTGGGGGCLAGVLAGVGGRGFEVNMRGKGD